MEKTLEKMLPILDVQQGVIVSRQGDATLAYRLELPEIFTLSDTEYESFHQAWLKAIRVLPKHTVLYKQDWFIRTGHRPDFSNSDTSFLDGSSDRFFNERPFLDHSSYLFLTKKPAGRKAATSLFSSLARPSLIPRETLGPQELQDFRDAAGQFQRILEDSGFVKAIALLDDDIYSSKGKAGLLERYCTLSEKEGEHLFGDLVFDDALLVGGKFAQLYTLGDAANLPSLCGPRITYDRYSTDRTRFSVGFASPLGQLLSCNHIYSQYIFIDDASKTLQSMEGKRLRLQSLSAYSRENLIARDATNDFLNEAISRQRLPVKGHFNVLVWQKHYHENYGYDLEAVVSKHPIKELDNPSHKEDLLNSLKKGNRQSATFIKEGNEVKQYIEATPQFKTLTIYDSDQRRVDTRQAKEHQQSQTGETSRKQDTKAKQSNNEEEGPGEQQEKKQRRKKQSL